MKKILRLILASALAISVCACGGSTADKAKEPGVTTASKENQPDQPEQDEAKQSASASITETVLVDEAGVKITAKALENGGTWGASLWLAIDNNSGKNLTVQCRNASVNGYMVDTMMSVDIVDGKKANDELVFMSSDLENCGISTIADMEFAFHIFTTEGWEDYLDTPQIQLKTSAADTYQYNFDDSGYLAYDGNGVKITIKGLAENHSIFGPSIIAYIENTSDRNITVQTRNVSVNGYMMDATFSSDVMTGKHAVDAITFMSSDLEENEITAIENVDLSFHIFDMDSWDDIVDTDIISMGF